MDQLNTDWKYKGEFLKIGIKHYIIPGQTVIRDYEVIERVNKGDHDQTKLDGVNILPILINHNTKTKRFLLIKNYRPPVNKFCVEFPGGLINDGESIEEAALRELKEETGFTGKLLKDSVSPLLPVCSGTGSESTCIVPILIDENDPRNNSSCVQQHLDNDEIISTFSVLVENFCETIKQLAAEGYGIELQVYYLSLALLLRSCI